MSFYTNTDGTNVDVVATCPEGHATVLDDHAIEYSQSECELCGSHGDLEVSWKCPECETGYIHTITSW